MEVFNWLDVVILIILIRTTYIGFKRGAIGELILTGGFLVLCFFLIRYYKEIGVVLSAHIKIPSGYSPVLAYITLLVVGFILLWILSKVITNIVGLAALGLFNKILGLLVGLIKGVIFCSLILYFLLLIEIDYLSILLKTSYSGLFISNVSTYMQQFIERLMGKL